MKPIVIEMSIELPAAPEAVWRHLVDWEHLGEWMKEASEFRVLTPHREGVGVEAEATIRIAGIKTHDRIRVTRWDPPHTLELAHLGWVKGSGYMRADHTSGGTRLYWRETLIAPMKLIGAIGIRIVAPLMARVFERDLRLLLGLIEKGDG